MIQSASAHAQLFDGPGLRFRLERPSLPGRLRPGEVIVAVRLAAICGSDLHPYRGNEVGIVAGTAMGHESPLKSDSPDVVSRTRDKKRTKRRARASRPDKARP